MLLQIAHSGDKKEASLTLASKTRAYFPLGELFPLPPPEGFPVVLGPFEGLEALPFPMVFSPFFGLNSCCDSGSYHLAGIPDPIVFEFILLFGRQNLP